MSSEKIFKALQFACEKHKHQKRKGEEETPFINHPIKVAKILSENGEAEETDLLIAALLHDTIEDTETTKEEIENLFGKKVSEIVCECTDDKSLKKAERKKLQIECAAKATNLAKKLKLADKICNVYDIRENPPNNWSDERKLAYLDWSEAVANGLKGVNEKLEKLLEQEIELSRKTITNG